MKLFQMMKTLLKLGIPFLKLIGSLNIPDYVTNDPISDNISDLIIKLIVRYRKHPKHTHYRRSMQRKKREACCFFIFRSS